jgi:ribosomal protein S18 acetylase RimI-like enzyme
MSVNIELDSFEIVPFETHYGGAVLTWVRTRDEALNWAGLNGLPLDSSIFEQWHADPEVHGWVLLCDGVPIGYGEIWENFDADAVEVARVIVAPSCRGHGIGRVLVDRLCAKAHNAAVKHAFLRVRPGNAQAIRCYEGTGFRSVPSELASAYNAQQPIAYAWLRRTIVPDSGNESCSA